MSKDVKPDDWENYADELETRAKWMREGERVDVIWGQFEKVKTKRRDKVTGREYESEDVKVGIRLPDGKTGMRLVNGAVFQLIKKEYVTAGRPKVFSFLRPYRPVSR